MDRDVYNHWWGNVFLSSVRQWTAEPVALLMDNCAGHDPNTVDPIGQVKVFFFPPNVTSVYHLLDQGIISVFNTVYKRELSAQ